VKRALLTGLIFLLLTMVVVPGWLLTSESGLRWIYQQVETALAGTLQIQQVSGSLNDRVTLQGIEFKDPGIHVNVEQVVLYWDFWALLSMRIDVTSLDIQQLDIELLQTSNDANEPSSASGLQPLDLPLDLQIRKLAIDQVTLTQAGSPVRLQQLQLQASTRGSQIKLDGLEVRVADLAIDKNLYNFDISLSGDIDTALDYAHDLRIDWKTALPSGAAFDNSIHINGDLSATRLSQESRGALEAKLSLELNDLLESLSWQASLDVTRIDTSLLDSQLPVLRGALSLSAEGDLTMAQVSGRLDADSDDLGKINAQFDLRSLEQAQLADGLNIESLELGILEGKLTTRGQLRWSPILSWTSEVTANDINPAGLLPDWPGQLNSRLQTTGQIDNGQLSASANIAELSGTLRDYSLSLQSELQWRDDTLEVKSANLASGDTRITATGKVGNSIDLDWSLDSQNLAELYPGAEGQLKASGHLGGELEAPAVKAGFKGTTLRFTDYSVEAVEGDIVVDLTNWQQLNIRLAASNLDLQGQRLQSVDINADQSQIQASLVTPEIKAEIELAGALVDQRWHGKLVTADIDTTDFSTWHLMAPAAISLERESITSEPLCLISTQNSKVCSSLQQTAGSWDIDLELAQFPLQLIGQWTPVDLELDGVINATADLKYSPEGQLLGKLEVDLPAAGASYPLQDDKPARFDYRLGELTVSLEQHQISITTRVTLENEDHLEGSLTMPDADILQFDTATQPIQAKFSIEAHNWSVLNAMLPQIDEISGDLGIDIAVSGSIATPRLQGSARLSDGAFLLSEQNLRVEQLNLDLQSDGSQLLEFSIDAVAAAGKLALQGETLLDQDAGWPSTVSVNGKGFDLAVLLAPWIAQPLAIDGEMDANAELKFRAPDQLLGEVHFSAARGKLTYPLVAGEFEHWDYQDAFATLTLGEQGIKASSGFIMGDSNDMKAEVSLPQAGLLMLDPEQQQLNANVRINFKELDLIQYLVPDIDQVTGQLALDATVSGSLAHPQVILNSKIQQVSFEIPRLGLKIDQIKLLGKSDEQNNFDFKLSAHSGDGQLSIEGSSKLDAASGWPSNIHIKGENFEVARIPEATVTASPDLEFTIAKRSVVIEGDLVIPYAKLEPRDVSTATKVSSDTVIIGGEQAEEQPWEITTRVNLILGEKVTFFGFGFEGRLGGRLLVEESPDQLSRGTGEITIQEGRYRAYGQRLDVNDGRVLFTGGALDNPGLDLQALRKVDEVTVGLKILGRLQQPEIELFSDPTLGETDMLSYLLFGRPMDETSGTEGNAMGQAALALGLAGGDNLARRLGDRFGFDEVRVESNDTGDQASLVIGRYLSPELYVSYGVGLMESINSINLRYQLSERWHLEAESGEYQGADVLFSIER
jgi:autotransporter translocation and assembly factor TamB